jgi:hypothetical protein
MKRESATARLRRQGRSRDWRSPGNYVTTAANADGESALRAGPGVGFRQDAASDIVKPILSVPCEADSDRSRARVVTVTKAKQLRFPQ